MNSQAKFTLGENSKETPPPEIDSFCDGCHILAKNGPKYDFSYMAEIIMSLDNNYWIFNFYILTILFYLYFT